jgi:hypothetical protein
MIGRQSSGNFRSRAVLIRAAGKEVAPFGLSGLAQHCDVSENLTLDSHLTAEFVPA